MNLDFIYYDDEWEDDNGNYYDGSCYCIYLKDGDKIIDDYWYGVGDDTEENQKQDIIEWLAKHNLAPVDKDDWIADWKVKDI